MSSPNVFVGDYLNNNMQCYVYILASEHRGKLYIGVSSNLIKRVYEHKEGFVEAYSKSHNIKDLVYYETTENVESAIAREKQLKKWNRDWKIRLIEKNNPEWEDLYYKLI